MSEAVCSHSGDWVLGPAWLKVPALTPPCPFDPVVVIEPVQAQESKGRSLVRKGFIPRGESASLPDVFRGTFESAWHRGRTRQVLRKRGRPCPHPCEPCKVGYILVGSTEQPQQPVATVARGLVMRLGQGGRLSLVFSSRLTGRALREKGDGSVGCEPSTGMWGAHWMSSTGPESEGPGGHPECDRLN